MVWYICWCRGGGISIDMQDYESSFLILLELEDCLFKSAKWFVSVLYFFCTIHVSLKLPIICFIDNFFSLFQIRQASKIRLQRLHSCPAKSLKFARASRRVRRSRSRSPKEIEEDRKEDDGQDFEQGRKGRRIRQTHSREEAQALVQWKEEERKNGSAISPSLILKIYGKLLTKIYCFLRRI